MPGNVKKEGESKMEEQENSLKMAEELKGYFNLLKDLSSLGLRIHDSFEISQQNSADTAKSGVASLYSELEDAHNALTSFLSMLENNKKHILEGPEKYDEIIRSYASQLRSIKTEYGLISRDSAFRNYVGSEKSRELSEDFNNLLVDSYMFLKSVDEEFKKEEKEVLPWYEFLR